MKSYKEYSKSKLSEAVTINDNIWAYLNKEIDGLFDKLKTAVKDIATPRSDWMKNIHKRLFDLQYGKNEGVNYSRIPFTLSEYKSINELLGEMSSALHEAEDWGHVDGLIDLYKDKFKEIIKSLFARIRVNRKSPAGAAATPAMAPASPASPSIKPTTSLPPLKAPEVTKPLIEPEEEKLDSKDDGVYGVEPAPKTPSKPPMAPTPESPMSPNVMAPIDKKNDPHYKHLEDELVKLGLVSGMVLSGMKEDEAMDDAEEQIHTVTDPKEREQLIKLGKLYIQQQEKNGQEASASSRAAAYGIEAPPEDQEKNELLTKYHSGKNGQRARRRLLRRHAPEILAGHYIKAKPGQRSKAIPIEKAIEAYLKKRRAGANLPNPEVQETVAYYKDLLKNRTVSLLEEAEKIESIKDRVEFYKLRLTGS